MNEKTIFIHRIKDDSIACQFQFKTSKATLNNQIIEIIDASTGNGFRGSLDHFYIIVK